jgi:hypothetical protein
LRRNNLFASLDETDDPPGQFTMEELLAELEKEMNSQVCGKRKRSNSEGAQVKIWSRMMCL